MKGSRVALTVFLISSLVFILRETRILWGIEGLEIFDLACWGLPFSESSYALQNGVALGTALSMVLALWIIRRSDGHVSPSGEPGESFSEERTLDRSHAEPGETEGKRKHPFEMVNKNWKLVKLKERKGRG